MDKIEVKVFETHGDPGQWASFLARLTQRGHKVKNMADLEDMFNQSTTPGFVKALAQLPHGTIKRFTPITVAIVGASRRFLAQIRTSQVGTNFVSASLQYSDYSGEADFVVPYEIMKADAAMDYNSHGTVHEELGILGVVRKAEKPLTNAYLKACKEAMREYEHIAECTDNDTAGYVAPQGLRNILILQANHQSWDYLIRLRGCNRNTVETQYVVMRIWEELLKTQYGEEFFGLSGPDCMGGGCREGKFNCGNPMRWYRKMASEEGRPVPRVIIDEKWPLLVNYM